MPSMTSANSHRPRIGVFGGTFDPIHNAHLAIAQAARDAANLDTLLFVVAHVPPHKRAQTWASPAQRLAMVQAALADRPGMEASDLELRREGPSYTADTLRVLHDQNPDADYFLIVGMDSLLDLPNWRDPETVVALARILAVPRPGEIHEVPEALARHVDVLPFPAMDISSTAVRQQIAAGEPFDQWVPAPAVRIIEEQRLYHDDAVRNTARR